MNQGDARREIGGVPDQLHAAQGRWIPVNRDESDERHEQVQPGRGGEQERAVRVYEKKLYEYRDRDNQPQSGQFAFAAQSFIGRQPPSSLSSVRHLGPPARSCLRVSTRSVQHRTVSSLPL